jgi:disulfide oxidoreductase YuzD
MKNNIALSSLAMDLQRAALGYHRGSKRMGKRFFEEALKRKNEVDISMVKPYIRNLLNKMETIKLQKETDKIAEDALLYSILFQNAAVKMQS